MNLPKKIDAHFLRDSIIQIIFKQAITEELIVGRLEEALGEKYSHNLALVDITQQSKDFYFEQRNPIDFIHKELNIKVTPQVNSIVINMIDSYPGWAVLSKEVHYINEVIQQKKIFNHPISIAIRYINEFKEESLFDIINISQPVEIFESYSQKAIQIKQVLNRDIKHNGKNIDVRLLINLVQQFGQQEADLSIIDIDLKANLENESMDSLHDLLNKIHEQEKKSFFKLLKPTYLNGLNPQY